MADIDELAATLPIDQIAQQLGEDPEAVRRAVGVTLPALLGGLEANAQDPGGEASLSEAVAQHDDDVATPPVDLADVDVADGQKIAHHIFGAQEDQVVQQLGSTGVSSSLVRKLIPILAPIVLSYLAKQMGAKGGSGGGALGSILGSILGGAAQGTGGPSTSGGSGVGGVLGDLLGGLLGGGRKA
ncbi:DUF937 domain-containing protein [Nocardioides seonyuensis]|uniref:DUF937 domain-containing protein n=1 Tax=Nocardioides seonyuensis TaxID=2518371 RepID=A0A4P7IF55_9ACTN|nr:DUF937 domain-containing protein [Nocardioides seonyuensis]QBX54311.1 DUF937 domain-containing protein [Nocardioides seonyuensis]